MSASQKKDLLDWINLLHDQVPIFLSSLRSSAKPGYYSYSYSGDYLSDKFHWGLGNSVFYLKIAHILNLKKIEKEHISSAQRYVRSFKNKNGEFTDKYVQYISTPMRFYIAMKTKDNSNLFNKLTTRAETRQSISALSLFDNVEKFSYSQFPTTKLQITNYLNLLDWKRPWGSGSHFSHLIFFLKFSQLNNKQQLINHAIKYVTDIQQPDGFVYQENSSTQQKVNGMMKIMTGLEVAEYKGLKHVKKIIDFCLLAQHDEQACDNFNIVYVLQQSLRIIGPTYKFDQIESFMLHKLSEYKRQYFSQFGGFSFFPNRANKTYYGAFISRGRKEPDIHGTKLFLWGISAIVHALKLPTNNKFNSLIP